MGLLGDIFSALVISPEARVYGAIEKAAQQRAVTVSRTQGFYREPSSYSVDNRESFSVEAIHEEPETTTSVLSRSGDRVTFEGVGRVKITANAEKVVRQVTGGIQTFTHDSLSIGDSVDTRSMGSPRIAGGQSRALSSDRYTPEQIENYEACQKALEQMG